MHDDNGDDHDDDAPGFDPVGPPASTVMFTTAAVLAAVAEGVRSQAVPLVHDTAVQGMRAAFTAVVDALERRDPAARSVLRQVAVARLMAACDGDPRCAGLARDASDPLHHEWLMLMSDHLLRKVVARARSGSGGDDVWAVLGGLGRG
jgi:hypothetical protein